MSIVKKYYQSGILKSSESMKDSVKHGTCTYWYPNGDFHYSQEYRNDEISGDTKIIYGDGAKYEWGFKHGMLHGKHKWTTKHGDIEFYEHYIYGERSTEEEYRTLNLTEKLAGLDD